MKAAWLAACLLVAATGSRAQTSHAQTLDAVRKAGELKCGVQAGLAGFSQIDGGGVWHGLDVDICRAVAAAALGDGRKVKFVSLTPQTRFTALQSGEIDLLTFDTTWTLSRETATGLLFAGINFYDGQGFMVRADSDAKAAKDLDGATVCLQPGTVTELNLSDFERLNKVRFRPVVIESLPQALASFQDGRCDAYTADASALAGIKAGMRDARGVKILPDIVSKEPLGPSVRSDDVRWFKLVRWTLFAMIAAEELGVTRANVDEMLKSADPGVRRLLGVENRFGESLGVSNDWAVRVIKAVGNYGEIFERNMGAGSPLGLPRGLNALWTKGGLMYAPPVR